MTRRVRSTRCSWWRRKARRRRFAACARWLSVMVCSARCTRIAAAISHTGVAGEKVSRTQLTQVGRALAQLGIEHIAAYSPEARGRSERVFRTLQDRLPKELRLAGITSPQAAEAGLARA